MRFLRLSTILSISFVSTLFLAAPASADVKHRVDHPNGDWAQWNSTTNNLTVCDQTGGNGTAMAILDIIGGTDRTLFDTNGAQPGCGFAGDLSVDDSKSANVIICANASATVCYFEGPFGL